MSDFRENSRFQCGPPPKLMRELHHGRLVLSDYEIGDEDIAVLIRFFYNKKVIFQYYLSIFKNNNNYCRMNRHGRI